MNKDDLLALVMSATSGWMSSSDRELSRTPTGRAHQRLAALVHLAGSTQRDLTRLRRRLIQEINTTSESFLHDALLSVATLRDSFYAIEPPNDARDPLRRLPFNMVPPARNAEEVLGLALALRSRPANDQFQAMKLLEAYEELDIREHTLHTEPSGGYEDHLARLRAAVNLQSSLVKDIWRKLTSGTQELLNEEKFKYPGAMKYSWQLPVAIPLQATDEELRHVAGWTKAAGAAMYRPLRLDEAGDPLKTRAFKRAWGQYRECGNGLQLLSVWAMSVATSAESRRCEICYRQVGLSGRRYCQRHKRNADSRQDRRDLHVSSFYKPLALKDIRAADGLIERFGQWKRSAATMGKMRQVAASQGVNDELLQAAADLATTLRTLRPLVRPVVSEQLAALFRHMLELARLPYQQHFNGDWEHDRVLTEARVQAPKWLSWQNLLGYTFGRGTPAHGTSRRVDGLQIDLSHPASLGLLVIPERAAFDLLHVGAWQTVDAVLDKYLYIDRDAMVALRRTSNRHDGHVMSLAEIGKKLGASHEAIRQNLAYTEDRLARTSERKRTVASGAQRLRQELGLDS